jgi:hypothetical protein
MALAIPQPGITQDGAAGTKVSAAKAITLTCSPVTFSDGTALDAQHASRSTYVLYRQPAGSTLQAWNPATKSWQPAEPTPSGDTLFFKDGAWTGLLVAAGKNDAAGNPLFDPTVSASYSVACMFAGTDAAGATESGTSSPSQSFMVMQPGADLRAGLSIEPQDPAEAGELQIFLKDSSLATRATVTLTSSGGDYSVTLAAGGARVEVSEDGTIALTPAASGTVHITGQLEIDGSLSLNGIVST